ncbi:MBL fold metallo-hydrolase [Cellvibrio sp. PSBB023]|uniref:MBL fold metallo-hydrolase n=1 Tax=Cellvibrio sp. PSBB023 TaxID=1945512 RepID=UPI00099021F4|nr:MBL fold metallo-hydrolase [Cellvibrio sp. PSBB023]AQT62011.1 MBL fold metallo-hydrolase [Cellvibrio sp. PSBB023]
MKNAISAMITATSLLLGTALANASDLHVTTYNPADKSIFPVSSSLVTGEKEAILVDAQFGVGDGQALVELIRASGKKLTRIYISNGDPDYYFGLEPIVAAFPKVEILASSAVVTHIEKTKNAKLAYWGPILGEQAPTKIYVPQVFDKTTLTLENHTIEIREINTHNAYLWVPSTKTALGGVLVSSGIHLWTADSKSPQARADWIAALTRLAALNPNTVIPGHYVGAIPPGDAAVVFTRDYLQHYEQLLHNKPDATQLVTLLKKAYPELPTDEGMVISAKVVTGEMDW